MKQFAKLFDDSEIGQILVVMDKDEEDCPQVTVKFWYAQVNGYCKYSFGFTENEEGFDKQQKLFDKFDIRFALDVVAAIKHDSPLKKASEK